ncbi:MAG: hypothetical protein FJ265_17010 [Planctomycetes bacterium]|nr:hypothetical protein [Planctomycetota bacterium]
MLRHLALGAGFAATLVALPAQEVSHSVTTTALGFDSGYLTNSSAAAAVLWSQDVTLAGDWVQLHFRDTNLPPGTRLRLHGTARPGQVQWHDAGSLRDYGGWSCEFLGPTVRVALHGAALSHGNRVRIDLGVATTFSGIGIDTLCDGADDRVLSNDPRSCRLGTGCSAWLFSEYAVATAGHCTSGGTGGVMLHFNVPLSSASGVPQPAHPDDQYALGPFLQFLSAGVGQDWATMAAVRNSNTQLFPGQAQGSWYQIATPPAAVSGDLRVTGYGTGNGTLGSPVANQAQKTHAGPRVAAAVPDAVCYRADTTGGNSGSPVLLETTGQVIAVHTHGGCGNGIGENSGTSTARADWTAARQAALALRVVGGFRTFGQGCGGAFGVPALTFGGVPELGRLFTVRVANLNPAPGLLGILLIGFSDQQWSGGALPASLAPLGMQGCSIHVSDHGVAGMPAAYGQALRSYLVPSSPGWLGASLYYQYFGLDPTSGTAVGAVASNAGEVRFGN